MKIRLEHIVKDFDKKLVIQPTTLVIDDGSFTTLLGASGCGKTTLLRMIAGLETPDDGEIWLDDTCVFSRAQGINVPPEKRNLGFVFQDFALWPHMTVFENVAFGLRARHQTDGLKERVHESLKTVHLEDYEARYPHQLSGGQQQRVAFARAIAVQPGCILFDEPLSALDALLRDEMRHELKELTSDLGITSVFVTHDQTEAMSMSDKIAVIDEGHIDQYDTPEEIYHHPLTRFVASFVGKSNWLSDDAMFRPEAAVIVDESTAKLSTPGNLSYELTVKAVQYLGDSYEITASYGERKWILHSSRKASVGQKISITVDPRDVVTWN